MRGSRLSTPSSLCVVFALCFSLGCQEQNRGQGQARDWDQATYLGELVGFNLGSAGHSRWCTVGTHLEPGQTAPRAVVCREIVKYLARRPDALKTFIDTDEQQSDFWHPWRGRDVWASVLADLEGIDLRLYRWDSVEERERKIADLLRKVDTRGRAGEQETGEQGRTAERSACLMPAPGESEDNRGEETA